MSDAPEPKATYASLLKYPLIQIPLVIGAVLGILTQGVVAYKDTQEALQLQAQANNARLKERAEAERIDAEATIALEQAKNAVQRAKSEADILVAEADKIEAEAITLREKAYQCLDCCARRGDESLLRGHQGAAESPHRNRQAPEYRHQGKGRG